MATMEATNSHHQPYPLPASPTLTNPDMILPDYDSPSDHSLDERDNMPLMMWKNAQAATSGPDLQHMHVFYNGQSVPGPATQQLQHQYGSSSQQLQHPYGPAVPITPTTPIIYGNGTMLSDIGEVTEVESTIGKPPSASSRSKSSGRGSSTRKGGDSGSDAALRSSPTMGLQAVPKRRSKGNLIGSHQQQRERRSSIESNSTVTTQDQALFADFDDSISVGDSVFQGDDEESVAESYAEEAPPPSRGQTGGLLAPANIVTKAGSTGSGEGGSGNEAYSTTSISRRAEQILANAKRRLSTMEGNLSRARSSIYSPHSTSSYGSDGSTPSPPMVRASSAFHQRGGEGTQYSPGHTRMSSDIAIPHSGPAATIYTQRSASALGAAGGYRQPLGGSKSSEHIHDSFTGHYGRSNYSRDTVHLEPLSEDEVAPSPAPQSLSSAQAKDQSEGLLSPTFSQQGDDRGLTRSASVAQMRDLKDQMKDLKGKISTLREQARADSLKRRSLQSLRTPSPFTHARIDQWYGGPKPSQGVEGGAQSAERNPWNGELSSVDGENLESSGTAKEDDVEDEESIVDDYTEEAKRVSYIRHPVTIKTVGEEAPSQEVTPELADVSLEEQNPEEQDDVDDMQTENGDVGDEEAVEGAEDAEVEENAYGDPIDDKDDAYESESGESFYHDTLQHPVSHEDREDAFDYEHFFLHSAMGTISQQRLARRASRDSFSSEDSVETTRGPISSAPTSNGDVKSSETGRSRRNSTASTSTTDSFATADEGESIRSGTGKTRAAYVDEETNSDFPEQVVTLPGSTGGGPGTPQTARRTVFGPLVMTNGHGDSDTSLRNAVLRRPLSSSATASLHRPSISSFESTGTNRSFPLVNRPKEANGADDDNHSASELRAIEDSLLSETASICERGQQQAGHKHAHSAGDASLVSPSSANAPAGMQTLSKEDQYLVERLVASLGRCVLGLTESGRASVESRMYRRRIDAARRILEGLEGPGSV